MRPRVDANDIDVGVSGVDDVVDVDVSDVDGSDAEMRPEPEFAARAGGNSVIDVPIDDIGSASDAADKPGTRKARRATQPISPIHGRHGNSGEAGPAVADVPVEDVGAEGRPRRRCVRRRPVGQPEEDRCITGLLPPSGATSGGKVLQKTGESILAALRSACEPGFGCWRSGAPCTLGCKAIVRKHAATLAVEAAKAYNCTLVQRDLTLFDMAKPITENGRKVYRLAGIRLCRAAMCRVLGLSDGHLQRVRHARFDRRRAPREERRGPGYEEIYSFLWHVYESVAEGRPDMPLVVGQESDSVEAFLARTGDANIAGRATQADDALPRKFLPPGCPKDYWWMFCAEGRRVGSYGTFRRVWKQWEGRLSFDGFGEHAGCDQCSELRAAMSTAPDQAAKTSGSIGMSTGE